jgi:hypothetical protein
VVTGVLISLTPEEIELCKEFSYQCAKNQQRIEFGQHDTLPRPETEIGRDNFIGKIAEAAFAKVLDQKYGIHIDLDFNYYPRGSWDKQDAVINGWQIDVKGTRQGGKWMLIEWSKLSFRFREKNLSHLYVMASVQWDRKMNVPFGQVDLVGCAALSWLYPDAPDTLVLKKGECIPGTSAKLQADNFAIHFENLQGDWDKVINWITSNPPEDTSNYPDPYQKE